MKCLSVFELVVFIVGLIAWGIGFGMYLHYKHGKSLDSDGDNDYV